MRVAAHFGRLDWREMLDELEPHEWREWMAFAQVEGFGEDREDRRAATLTKHLLDAWCKDPVPLDKLMKTIRDDVQEEEEQVASPEEMAAAFKRMLGG